MKGSLNNSVANLALQAFEHVQTLESMAPLLVAAIGFLIGLAVIPDDQKKESEQAKARKQRATIVLGLSALLYPALVIFVATMNQTSPDFSYFAVVIQWYVGIVGEVTLPGLCGLIAGIMTSIGYYRYGKTKFSEWIRGTKNPVAGVEEVSDVRKEAQRKAKQFDPTTYYPELKNLKSALSGQFFVALDDEGKPIYADAETWFETNKIIAGPTRYGKGVELGVILEQSILRGNCVIYVDPKGDANIPIIMQKAAKKAGKRFRYVSLNDSEYGEWAPFKGGTFEDGLQRLEIAFRLAYTGNPATDYYKAIERAKVIEAFEQSRDVESLLQIIKMEEEAAAARAEGGKGKNTPKESRILAELKRWRQVKSLRPNSSGFSVEDALMNGDVVYVKGSLKHDVINTALKLLCIEVVQEADRLQEQRTHHITLAMDEFSKLTCRELSADLATGIGFKMDFIILCQSKFDLMNVADQPGMGKIIAEQIDQNAQIKIIYGGYNRSNADWVAELGGDVSKMVSKTERVFTNIVGGETWERQRIISAQIEPKIPVNTMLLLPRRVCAVFQPNELAVIGYTSPVMVRDNEKKELKEWLQQKIGNKAKSQGAVPQPKTLLGSEVKNEPSSKGFAGAMNGFESKESHYLGIDAQMKIDLGLNADKKESKSLVNNPTAKSLQTTQEKDPTQKKRKRKRKKSDAPKKVDIGFGPEIEAQPDPLPNEPLLEEMDEFTAQSLGLLDNEVPDER